MIRNAWSRGTDSGDFAHATYAAPAIGVAACSRITAVGAIGQHRAVEGVREELVHDHDGVPVTRGRQPLQDQAARALTGQRPLGVVGRPDRAAVDLIGRLHAAEASRPVSMARQ
jgi:hypothetical protein